MYSADLECIKNIDDKELHREIGKRLREIRMELRKKDRKYTQKNIAKELNLDMNGFSRTEQYKSEVFSLSRNVLIKLLIYYNLLGYNIEWILKPDNKDTNKFTFNL